MQLRPYQTSGVDALRMSYRTGKRAPLYQLPTGGGKTNVFSYITRNAQANGNDVLILVHRAELLRQCSRTLSAWGSPHGVIAPRYPMTTDGVQVASVQTAVRRLHRMRPPKLIIVDEAHHTVAGTWQKVIAKFPDAKLLGVTATPARMDGRGLGKHCGGYFDDLVTGPSVQELIDGGFLSRPRVFASPRHLNLDGVRTRGGDFAVDDAARVMSAREIVGDAVDHYRRICGGQPAIAFCCSLAHALTVCNEFTRAGFRARRIDGTMDDDERKEIVDALGSGRLDVMVSVDLVSEGFDVPSVVAAIMLRPTQSEILYLQQVGRALRPAPGKDSAFIIDHAGNVARHGMPQEAREWSLDGRRRRDTPPAIRQCPGCYAMLTRATRVCPECGMALTQTTQPNPREIVQRAGELIELTPAMIAQRQVQRAWERSAARTREELERLARERGYRMSWVDHIMDARARRGRT